MKLLLLIAAVATALVGCGTSNDCAEAETQCNENTVEVCNTEGAWEEIENCDDVSVGGLTFECGYDETVEVHTCLFVGGKDAGPDSGND